jgi:hypothetical protein
MKALAFFVAALAYIGAPSVASAAQAQGCSKRCKASAYYTCSNNRDSQAKCDRIYAECLGRCRR